MFCSRCGIQMSDDAVFCPECGTSVKNAPAAPAGPTPASPYTPAPASPAPERQYASTGQSRPNYGPAGQGAQPQPPYQQPTPPGYGVSPREHVTDFLIPSFIMTICCCNIFGAVALIFSAYSRTKLTHGDIQGAKDDAAKAKLVLIIGLAVYVLFVLLYMIRVASGGTPMPRLFNHMRDFNHMKDSGHF